MNGILAKGIAHVSFCGGGIFLPARNPYDREMLAEHVTNRVRAKGQVQVIIDDQEWMVYLSPDPSLLCCSVCSHPLPSACYSAGSDGIPFCVKCAFAERRNPVRQRRESATREAMMALDTSGRAVRAAMPQRGAA